MVRLMMESQAQTNEAGFLFSLKGLNYKMEQRASPVKVCSPKETCVLCHKTFSGFGNNPQPLATSGNACDECNELVIAERRRLGANWWLKA